MQTRKVRFSIVLSGTVLSTISPSTEMNNEASRAMVTVEKTSPNVSYLYITSLVIIFDDIW